MRILIAEDDEALGKFVRQGLESEHYGVDLVQDGEQAKVAATDSEYDLVILDLNLPKVDGVGVLRHLRLKKPSLPVLVLTQRTRVEDKVECLDTGADDLPAPTITCTRSSTRLYRLHFCLKENPSWSVWKSIVKAGSFGKGLLPAQAKDFAGHYLRSCFLATKHICTLP